MFHGCAMKKRLWNNSKNILSKIAALHPDLRSHTNYFPPSLLNANRIINTGLSLNALCNVVQKAG